MEEKKVLICAPVGDGKEYSINEWLMWIATQKYKNYDVALCVNGRSQKTLDHKISMFKQVEICNKPIEVLELPFNKYHTTNHRISYSRELLRKYAIEKNYDFILWLDTDTIPLVMDAIPLLMEQDKEVISGLYFYKGTNQSVIIDADTSTNMRYELIEELIASGDVVQVWGFGFGCVLMKKEILNKFSFDYKFKYEDWSEDFTACELLDLNKVDRWFFARIVCKHYHEKDFSVGDSRSLAEQKHEGSIRKNKPLSTSGKNQHLPAS